MKIQPSSQPFPFFRCTPLLLVAALQACGGGGSSANPATATETPTQSTAPVAPDAPAPADTTAPSTPVPQPGVTPAPGTLLPLAAATSCSIPAFREVVLQRVNLARSSGHVCGTEVMPAAAPLQWNDLLFSAAARHSTDMATRNYFSHVTPEGIDFSQRVAAEGYGWSAVGENIAGGQTSVDSVMAQWMASEGHCRNIMQPVFTEVALACVAQPGSSLGYYWTMELGRR